MGSFFSRWAAVIAFAASLPTQLAVFVPTAFAQEEQAAPIAELASATGKVSVLRSGEKISGSRGMKLFASDQLMTGSNSAAKILFADGSNFVVMQESSIEVEAYWTEAHAAKTTINSVFNVVRGKARFFFKPRDGGHEGTVKTANAIMGVRGTSFFVDTVKEKETELVVLTGTVAVHNPKKPDEEVLVKEKQTTSISFEKAPLPPTATKKEVVAQLEEQASHLPDIIPDGQPAKEIELPSPTIPVTQGKIGRDVQMQRATIIKQIISPSYAVIPIGAVMASRATLTCDKNSLNRLKKAAQNLDPETVLLGKELAQCPGLQSETLFWLGFFHQAQGEMVRAMELGKLVREKEHPLDSPSDREKILQNALEGNTAELSKQVKAKNSPYAKDTESLLTLARTYTRIGQFKDARNAYAEHKKINSLKPNFDAAIELGYAQLLEGAYADAENNFSNLASESLDDSQTLSVKRGLALAQYKQLSISGTENDSIEFYLGNDSNYDKKSAGGIGARWNSKILDAQVRSGDVAFEDDAKDWSTDTSAKYLQLLAGKRLTLSSGFALNGLLGVDRLGETNSLAMETVGSYRFAMGASAGGGFSQHALGLYELVPSYAVHWPVRTIKLNSDFKRSLDLMPLAAFRADFDLIGEYDTKMTQDVIGRIPIHRGSSPYDYINIMAQVIRISHSENMAEYYSPAQELTTLAGFEWNWFIGTLWGASFKAGTDVAFGFVSRDAQSGAVTETQTPLRARTKPKASETRELVKSESMKRIAPRAEIDLGRKITLFMKSKVEDFQTSEGKKTWDQSTFELGLRWKYNQGTMPK
jgi:tetratricopeptide (TPR) repeat protein